MTLSRSVAFSLSAAFGLAAGACSGPYCPMVDCWPSIRVQSAADFPIGTNVCFEEICSAPLEEPKNEMDVKIDAGGGSDFHDKYRGMVTLIVPDAAPVTLEVQAIYRGRGRCLGCPAARLTFANGQLTQGP